MPSKKLNNKKGLKEKVASLFVRIKGHEAGYESLIGWKKLL